MPIDGSIKSRLQSAVSRSIREGALFKRLLHQLEDSEHWSLGALQQLQLEKLNRCLAHAQRHVPHYRELSRSNSGWRSRLTALENLATLPILTKDEIRGAEKRFCSLWPLLKFKACTSGTSGAPLVTYRDRFSVNLEHAALWRLRRWAGVDLSEKRATIRGDIVTDVDRREPPFWVLASAGRQLLMSSYHLSDELIPHYVDRLRRFEPGYLEAYPSSAFRIARFIEDEGLDPIAMKAVITSSEMLLDHQKAVIERAFGPLFDYYGNSERVAFLPMCEHGNYHCALDYSVVEFIPSGKDGLHEIVGTAVHNRAMSLVRYRTGDFVELSGSVCECGRSFPVIDRIVGRQDDYILTPSGRWVGRLDRAARDVPNLIETQLVQEDLHTVRVVIVVTPSFSEADSSVLTAGLRERLGSDMTLKVERVTEIARTSSGKFKFVVSKIAKP